MGVLKKRFFRNEKNLLALATLAKWNIRLHDPAAPADAGKVSIHRARLMQRMPLFTAAPAYCKAHENRINGPDRACWNTGEGL